jgi:hypothetical protein
MIRTKAQQKRYAAKVAERLRLVEAQRVDSMTRWRYRKLRDAR